MATTDPQTKIIQTLTAQLNEARELADYWQAHAEHYKARAQTSEPPRPARPGNSPWASKRP